MMTMIRCSNMDMLLCESPGGNLHGMKVEQAITTWRNLRQF